MQGSPNPYAPPPGSDLAPVESFTEDELAAARRTKAPLVLGVLNLLIGASSLLTGPVLRLYVYSLAHWEQSERSEIPQIEELCGLPNLSLFMSACEAWGAGVVVGSLGVLLAAIGYGLLRRRRWVRWANPPWTAAVVICSGLGLCVAVFHGFCYMGPMALMSGGVGFCGASYGLVVHTLVRRPYMRAALNQ